MQYCINHPHITIQFHSVKGKNMTTGKAFFYDVPYCPECFEDHAKTGKTMCMDITKEIPHGKTQRQFS